MTLFNRWSLRSLLTVPYVALVLLLAVVVGTLSYRTGRNAVDNLSGQLLQETAARIALATKEHVAGAHAVLETAFPQGLTAPAQLDDATVNALRQRFWLATSIHRDPINYAYYGDRHGRFLGVLRTADQTAELRLRREPNDLRREPDGLQREALGVRQVHRYAGIEGALGPATPEQRVFDPRERPWFSIGQAAGDEQRWTPIYIDFNSGELVTTRVRRVATAQGDFEGVVAADLPLARISSFLKSLRLSPNALAMIVEPDGHIVGISRGDTTKASATGSAVRLNAASSNVPLAAATYAAVGARMSTMAAGTASTTVFEDERGQKVQVGYTTLQDELGLNWRILVAVPRSDFLAGIVKNYVTTVWLTMGASLLAVLIGLAVLSTVSRELRALATAARRVGEGQMLDPVRTQRNDALGDLARSFSDMQERLLTDQLTGLQNREAVIRGIEDRIVQRRRRSDPRPFAVLFADFNRFKQINDRYGHDVGDAVLRELALRIRHNVRTQDLVARYAGDEFVVLLDSIEQASDAHVVRTHLEGALRNPLEALNDVAPGEAGAGATFGVAVFPDDAHDVDGLIKHADADMYRRKAID